MIGRLLRPVSRLRLSAAVAGASLAPAVLQSPQPSYCATESGGGSSPLRLALPDGLPEITPLQLQFAGVSGLAGYTAGYAIKRAFRVVIFTTGVCFMGLQTLAHNDLITIHWDKMEEKFNSVALDNGSLEEVNDKVQAYLAAGLPSGAAFTTAFVLGLRS